MAVVSLKNTSSWTNSDGLVTWFGTDEAVETRGGEFEMDGGEHVTEVLVNLAALPTAASGNEQIVAENVTIPNGAFIRMVSVFVVKEPTTSGSPNLDFGLVDQDRTTELDFNGLLAAADAFETGTDLGTYLEYVKGTTEAGALIGTRLTNTGILTCSADTADWTAGVLRLRVHWYVPTSADV